MPRLGEKPCLSIPFAIEELLEENVGQGQTQHRNIVPDKAMKDFKERYAARITAASTRVSMPTTAHTSTSPTRHGSLWTTSGVSSQTHGRSLCAHPTQDILLYSTRTIRRQRSGLIRRRLGSCPCRQTIRPTIGPFRQTTHTIDYDDGDDKDCHGGDESTETSYLLESRVLIGQPTVVAGFSPAKD